MQAASSGFLDKTEQVRLTRNSGGQSFELSSASLIFIRAGADRFSSQSEVSVPTTYSKKCGNAYIESTNQQRIFIMALGTSTSKNH